LRSTLSFLAKLTHVPESIGPPDMVALRKEGVTDRAIVDAVYICVGFNVINRIADTLDFSVPPPDSFVRGAKFMRRFGYKLMSGSWMRSKGRERTLRVNTNASSRSAQSIIDPYHSMMRLLEDVVFRGPGTLDVKIREAAGAGAEISGTLGEFIKKIAQADYEGIGGHITDLHREGYSDDQIFEATISAAVGAGVRRLKLGLSALRGDSSQAVCG